MMLVLAVVCVNVVPVRTKELLLYALSRSLGLTSGLACWFYVLTQFVYYWPLLVSWCVSERVSE